MALVARNHPVLFRSRSSLGSINSTLASQQKYPPGPALFYGPSNPQPWYVPVGALFVCWIVDARGLLREMQVYELVVCGS
jgi:hypothetical protein